MINTSGYFGNVRRELEQRQGVLVPTSGNVVAVVSEWLDLPESGTRSVLNSAVDRGLLQFAGVSAWNPQAIWIPPRDRNYHLVTDDEARSGVATWIQELSPDETVEVYGNEHLAVLIGLPPTAGHKARSMVANFEANSTVLIFDDYSAWPWEAILAREPVPA